VSPSWTQYLAINVGTLLSLCPFYIIEQSSSPFLLHRLHLSQYTSSVRQSSHRDTSITVGSTSILARRHAHISTSPSLSTHTCDDSEFVADHIRHVSPSPTATRACAAIYPTCAAIQTSTTPFPYGHCHSQHLTPLPRSLRLGTITTIITIITTTIMRSSPRWKRSHLARPLQ
jgi:hypothetical protein